METSKNIKPKLIIDPEYNHFFEKIYGDENRISQILINFLSYSFKLTPACGNIQIELKVINDEE